MGRTVIVTVLPQNQKTNLDRDKIEAFGQRTVLDAPEKSYLLYEGREIEVAESYEELKVIVN